MAAIMKTPVAVIERGDNRAMPQMPWPDVQPLPSLVPNPDQKTGHNDGCVVRRHLRHRHPIANQRGSKRCSDKADDKGQPPKAVVGAGVHQSIGDAADTSNTAVEQHQKHRR